MTRVFLARAGLAIDDNSLRLTATNVADLPVGIFPDPVAVALGSMMLNPMGRKGLFLQFVMPAPREVAYSATLETVQSAGRLRTIALGKINKPVAEEPSDADFAQAAVWRIKLPANLDLSTDLILRFHYIGDVARVTLDGKLLTDDFYNGNAFEIGLRRCGPGILKGDLRVAILPLQKNAPIHMAAEARPEFGEGDSLVELKSVEIVPRYQVEIAGRIKP